MENQQTSKQETNESIPKPNRKDIVYAYKPRKTAMSNNEEKQDANSLEIQTLPVEKVDIIKEEVYIEKEQNNTISEISNIQDLTEIHIEEEKEFNPDDYILISNSNIDANMKPSQRDYSKNIYKFDNKEEGNAISSEEDNQEIIPSLEFKPSERSCNKKEYNRIEEDIEEEQTIENIIINTNDIDAIDSMDCNDMNIATELIVEEQPIDTEQNKGKKKNKKQRKEKVPKTKKTNKRLLILVLLMVILLLACGYIYIKPNLSGLDLSFINTYKDKIQNMIANRGINEEDILAPVIQEHNPNPQPPVPTPNNPIPNIENPVIIPNQTNNNIPPVDPILEQQKQQMTQLRLDLNKHMFVENVEKVNNTIIITGRTNKKDIIDLNRLTREVQKEAVKYFDLKTDMVKAVISSGKDIYIWETPRKIIQFIERLHYEDRHSSQLWWDKTTSMKNGRILKNNVSMVNLYVQNPTLAEVEIVNDGEPYGKFNNEKFTITFEYPSEIKMVPIIEDGKKLTVKSDVKMTEATVVMLTTSLTPVTEKDYNKIYLNKTKEFEKTRGKTFNLKTVEEKTYLTIAKQEVKAKVYKGSQEGKVIYMYYVVGFDGSRVYEFIVIQTESTFKNDKEKADTIIESAIFGKVEPPTENTNKDETKSENKEGTDTANPKPQSKNTFIDMFAKPEQNNILFKIE